MHLFIFILNLYRGKLRLSSITNKNEISILSENIEGHNARIRCSKYVPEIGCFFTGGEDNKISMWKFDPINIKPNQIKQNEKTVPYLNANLPINDDNTYFSGYGKSKHTMNNGNAKKRNNWFKPY